MAFLWNTIYDISDLLEHDDCNIIGVDWNPLSPAPNYPLAAKNALEVGRAAGEFVKRLMDKTGLTHDKVCVTFTFFICILPCIQFS